VCFRKTMGPTIMVSGLGKHEVDHTQSHRASVSCAESLGDSPARNCEQFCWLKRADTISHGASLATMPLGAKHDCAGSRRGPRNAKQSGQQQIDILPGGNGPDWPRHVNKQMLGSFSESPKTRLRRPQALSDRPVTMACNSDTPNTDVI